MIRRDRVKPFPEHGAKLIGKGKVGEGFAMNPTLFLGNFEPDCADEFALRPFSGLLEIP